MIIGLIIILAFVLILPFTFRQVEHNLEYFLFSMGLLSTIVGGVLSFDLIIHILENKLLYFITGAVLIAGLIFNYNVERIKHIVEITLKHIPIPIFIFIIIVFLGLISSFITAIISALILVEILHVLPIKHKTKVKLTVICSFSIGLGAALTPIGEPLSTIVTSALKVDFWYLFRLVGGYVIPGVIALGLIGAFIKKRDMVTAEKINHKLLLEYTTEDAILKGEDIELKKEEKLSAVFNRALKIFVFVLALELLGSGFKQLINTYIIHLDSKLLYWINISSAVLDNATLAAAEVSPQMSIEQIKAILIGLLISGGMLIPGNIPNIISAGKLKIKSREWAAIGIPLGFTLLLIYFIILFFLK